MRGPVMPRIISALKCLRRGVISAVDLSRQETVAPHSKAAISREF